MRLQAPKGTAGELHLHGRTFDIDKNGQVDIPDDLISSKIWSDGYTVAPEKQVEEPVKQKPEVSNAGKDKI